MTDFAAQIALLPHSPSQTTARGLLAPIVRATGHILYLVGLTAEPAYDLTEEEALRELADATEHLSRTTAVVTSAALSRNAKNRITAFVLAVGYAHAEYTGWAEADRGPNLNALAHRAASLAAFLDGELVGLNDSDAGRTL